MSPEYEDKESQKPEEDGDVIHGFQHHNELSSQVGQEPHEFEDPEESEGSKDRQAGSLLGHSVHDPVIKLHGSEGESLIINRLSTTSVITRGRR